ncbi:hypothetical protein TanjilG_16319 [Lupinus angustifolius]|uniref:Myb-like domain-containing protein n=1 Tax=Lupinus angustifolius TaxID=3871 RepID=A0A1J7H914_LUPAN|nr:PREDICTED: trihelix transcription factor ASIL1-like [Lupinus angustifolius]OIW09092.1 hypothetical protein TanjilG_16319 [Lupinus angustifolius]
MDGIEDDDTRYPSNPYRVSHHQQGFGYMSHRKLPTNVYPYSQPVENEYGENNNISESEEEEEQLGEEGDDDDDVNNIHPSEKDADDNEDQEEDDADANGGGDENCDDNGDGEDDDDDDDDKGKSYIMEIDDDLERQPKKQKLKSLISAYEFAPRVPAPSAAAPKPSSGGRNPLTDWTEHETFVLLDVWGDRFLQHGRKSLRSEEWQEVAEKVSKVSRVERTDTQCRNRLDTLKKKYKKEKIKFPEMDGGTSNWVYFKRMDKLMSSPPQQAGISCGLDSGEYVSTNSRIYSNRANGLDETRDSPENTESTKEGSDGPHAKKRRKGRSSSESSSFRLLADSLHKFSNIYEKIENDRRQQMVELEKMRMDFQMEIETQRRQVLERLQSEISKLDQTEDDENDGSSENGM